MKTRSLTGLLGRSVLLLVGVVAVLAIAGCGGDEATPTAEPTPTATVASALPTATPDQIATRKAEALAKGLIYVTKEEILAGAREEGALVVSPGFEEEIDVFKDAFTAKYPFIKSFTWQVVSGTAAGQNFALELQAGVSDVDSFDLRSEYWDDLRGAGIIEGYDYVAMVEDGQLDMPIEVVDERFGETVWLNNGPPEVIAYNTDKVSASDAPQHWDDCLDPKWSGRFYVDTRPGMASRYLIIGEDAIFDWAKRLSENDPIFFRGPTPALVRLSQGEGLIYCGEGLHIVQRQIDKGLPIGMVIPEPVIISLRENTAINVNGDHPFAALLWNEWLASPEGAALIDSVDRLKGSIHVEGTEIGEFLEGLDVLFCDVVCALKVKEIETKIAIEGWGFPKVGYKPSG